MNVTAIIIVTDPTESLLERISQQFDDYELLILNAKSREHYYDEVNRAVDVSRTFDNVFLVVNGYSAFNALLAAKLAIVRRKFYLVEKINRRLRVLEVP